MLDLPVGTVKSRVHRGRIASGPRPGDRTGRGTDPAREDVRGNTTMSHPEPLLADYVDGSLDPHTRAEVDAHLRGCATCRAEVSLARAGSQRAQGLADPAAPAGIGEAAIAEAARLATERNPEVTPIAGRGAAAARDPANPGRRGGRRPAPAGRAGRPEARTGQHEQRVASGRRCRRHGQAYPSATTVELQHADYSFESLPSFAAALRTALSATGGAIGRRRPRGRGYADAGSCRLRCGDGLSRWTRAASRRPRSASIAPSTLRAPFRAWILARFKGEPAYLGVYLIGPGAELPPTLLQLNVASVHGCNPVRADDRPALTRSPAVFACGPPSGARNRRALPPMGGCPRCLTTSAT